MWPARRLFCRSPLSRARWKSPARLSRAASSQAIPRDRARYPPRRPPSRHRWAPRRPPHSRTTPGPRPRTAAACGLPCRAVELQGSGPFAGECHGRNWPGAARSRRRRWRSRSRRGHTSYICAAARSAPMRGLERLSSARLAHLPPSDSRRRRRQQRSTCPMLSARAVLCKAAGLPTRARACRPGAPPSRRAAGQPPAAAKPEPSADRAHARAAPP